RLQHPGARHPHRLLRRAAPVHAGRDLQLRLIVLFRHALSRTRLRFALPAGAGVGTPTSRPRLRARFVVSALAVWLAGCAESDPPLPTLQLDVDRVSVSGISSGAYMAHQAHLAFSSTIDGAALVAGGPYGCARGDL